MHVALSDLRASITAAPELEGLIRLEVAAPGATSADALRHRADALVGAIGLQPPGPRAWIAADDAGARRMIDRLLREDLAYSAPLLPARRATYLAERLVAALDPFERRFVTSGVLSDGLTTWTPLGAATFEVALVGADATQAFLLLATAED